MSSSSQIRQQRLMAALSVAEQLVAASPTAPFSARTQTGLEWGYDPATNTSYIGVELHFHHDPDAVAAFAAHVEATVTDEPGEYEGVAHVDTIARGTLNGVLFLAWTRVHVSAEATQSEVVSA